MSESGEVAVSHSLQSCCAGQVQLNGDHPRGWDFLNQAGPGIPRSSGVGSRNWGKKGTDE